MLGAGAVASCVGLGFGFLFRRKPVNDRAIGGGGEWLLLPLVCMPCIAISVAVYAFSAVLEGPEAAMRNCASISSVLAVLSAAIAASGWGS